MDDIASLASEVRRAIDGDPWYGSSASAVLEGVDAATAFVLPDGEPHSIWQIVRHMTLWARHVAYRVGGGPPCEPAGGDWPIVLAADETSWAAAVKDLRRSHEELVEAMKAAPAGSLDATGADVPIDDSGEPMTLRRAVLGVPQHDAYHCGQIVVIKRILSSRKTR